VTGTRRTLLKHAVIGAIVTLLIFYIVDELPSLSKLVENIYLVIFLTLLLTGTIWTTTNSIDRLLNKRKISVYLISTLYIVFLWTVLFLGTALFVGFDESIRNGRFEIWDTLKGYTIYRLWVYLGIGIIHGLTGGPFLTLDLNRHLK